MIKNIWSKIENKLNNTKILDRYILKQVIELFIMGVFVFTTIIFASDTFITLIKQIAKFGIPFKIAFIMILLNIPSVIVMTIPMGVLLSTVMTLNNLSLSSEITVMRACGISLNRIAKPIFGFAIIMALSSFVINETIVPAMTRQSTTLAMWSLQQKHIPDGKENFVFKETTDGGMLKRLFYVGLCKKNSLYNITFLDLSKKGTIQVLQAKEGETSTKGWSLKKCAAYTIGNQERVLNTSLSDTLDVEFGLDFSKQENKDFAKQKNFTQLLKYLSANNISPKDRQLYTIELFDKIALPITTIVFVLLGVPLAITPPRVKYNRGFLFSVLIIFIYYVMRAVSISLGGAGQLTPFLAAWLPNITLSVLGGILYYKKVYTIS
jgi:lipopolysaccharide export system permease protein